MAVLPFSSCDALVVGSGPNGLAAAIALAREGLSVKVVEARSEPGGGCRTAELTLPGFRHDMCAAVLPMAAVSPFLRALPLEQFGLEWIHPEVPLAHPLDGGRAAALWRDLDQTAAALPGSDGRAWKRRMGPLARDAEKLFPELLGPAPLFPRHPLALARFGLGALRSARGLALGDFATEEARALFAGVAAHSVLPLEKPLTAAVGLALITAGHAGGWPVVKGGSAGLIAAMAAYFRSLGGEIFCDTEVKDLRDLPPARAILFDTGPHALARIAASRLPEGYRRRLLRYRYGPAVFKLDLALDGPVPWTNPVCRKAGTVHAAGGLDEICESERACWENRAPERPCVLVAQQSACDSSRAPEGKHTLWAYAHVPNGYAGDATEPILAAIERFAPGFRDTILSIRVTTPRDFEAYNLNNVGGDVVGGVMDWRQLFTRPVARWNPHATPDPGVFICSSGTPPGGGVHGMCGWHASRVALRRVFHKRVSDLPLHLS